MNDYTQADRLARIDTPLGADKLILQGLSGSEDISQLFHYKLDLASEDGAISFKDIVGSPATVTINLQHEKEERYFNGIVSKFAQCDSDERFTYYRAELVPWLWFLTRAADCRIFQEKTIPKVIELVFQEAGFSDYELHLSQAYDEWDYCVQYRETHFNFVSRLMEQYGIHYFFKHQRDRHIMVLSDSPLANEPCPHQETANFEPMQEVVTESDIVETWEVEQILQPGKYALSDYNFTKPKTSLLSSVNSVVKIGGNEALEIYDFPGEYEERGVGEQLAKLRMEEEEAVHRVFTGATTCRAFQSGYRFKLTGHDVSEFNQEYLITSVHHNISAAAGFRSGEGGDVRYANSIVCIPYDVPFRPRRITPKPVIQGIQTAVVVGKSGEEIDPDKYGRIKVQFYWDRRGKFDEKSSCSIRVAQMWAGKKWGAMFIPRIGQEVVVSFLEGDPDQPLIIGSVYNDEQMPPYELPGERTKSTIKSYSSKGGGGFNEFRFEDKKGKEQIFIHAERNQDIRVKNDALEWIGKDRNLIVKGDQLEKIEGDKHLAITGDQNEKVDGTVSLKAGMDLQQKVGMKHALDAGMEIHLKAGMNVVIEAGATLTLKVGGNFVNINPGGVFIQGTMVMINSGGSAGSGSGASPTPPKEAQEADKANPGEKAAPMTAAAFTPTKFKRTTFSPQATVLREAAKTGVPFCEKCEAARKAREAGQA